MHGSVCHTQTCGQGAIKLSNKTHWTTRYNVQQHWTYRTWHYYGKKMWIWYVVHFCGNTSDKDL